ncbi:MAG: DNA polymerase III subunit alpha [Clostridia bacterium]|nr:DNA polymerase III subunit alpha [Clostridia bacterium]
MSGFVHLHLHSEYSLLEGACRIREIPAAVLGAGQNAAAITDSGVMFGCADFYRACVSSGVKPIIGMELCVSASDDPSLPGKAPGTLVLLCENGEGYANLSYISAHLEEIRGMRLCPLSLIREHHGGLIALSGGRDGEIFRALSSGNTERAERLAELFSSVFGKDCFYIELQNHGEQAERQLLSDLARLAAGKGLPVVATNDVHYLKKEDADLQTALSCIKEGRTTDSGPGLPTGEFWLKTADEMERLFGGYPGALENTVKIAGRCVFEMEFGKILLPSFPCPDGVTPGEELKRRAEEGLLRLNEKGLIPAAGFSLADYRERTEYELSVIDGMGFNDYFLIVSDYVGEAKRTGLPVGPGRGSGCGSLVALLTGITEVDPLKYGLFFERFLNPERKSMPDIDIDFDYGRREEMIAYVKEKYGSDHVSQIAAFGTMASRAALRDAARVLGLSPAETDNLCSLLRAEGDMSLGEAVQTKKVRDACGSPRTARVFALAQRLEGLPRNLSVHPAGVVISEKPVYEYLPLLKNGDVTVTQYEMGTVADIGLLKFDFLALRNLTVIDDTVKTLRRREPDFSFDTVDENDAAAYALISSGATAGVFQLESDGLRKTCMRMKPENLGDLTAVIALYRPGPMESIPKYIEGRKNPSSVKYAHPLLEPILRPTYGCIVYQEQVMNIFRTVAGYSLGRADLVRRAMAKKKAELLKGERESFITGAAENGMSEKDAGELFDGMVSFAGYAFNKSHAVAYGILTFRTAYLKAHYPGEYFTALMNSVIGSPEKIALYAAEAESFGIKVLPPDINSGGALFAYDGEAISFGLSAVKGVGLQLAEAIAAGRKNGKYTSLRLFLSSVTDRTAGRRPIEALIKCGAFDSAGIPRSRLLGVLDRELENRGGHGRGGIDGQLDIFSSEGLSSSEGLGNEDYPQLPEFSEKAMASMELELCGIAFTGRRPSLKRRGIPALGTEEKRDAPAAPEKERPENGLPRAGSPVVYVRVSSENGTDCKKARNLAGIFDGNVPFVLYLSDVGKYVPAGGILLSEYVISELKAVAGEENVAVRYKKS